jgi:hypothetical protein
MIIQTYYVVLLLTTIAVGQGAGNAKAARPPRPLGPLPQNIQGPIPQSVVTPPLAAAPHPRL